MQQVLLSTFHPLQTLNKFIPSPTVYIDVTQVIKSSRPSSHYHKNTTDTRPRNKAAKQVLLVAYITNCQLQVTTFVIVIHARIMHTCTYPVLYGIFGIITLDTQPKGIKWPATTNYYMVQHVFHITRSYQSCKSPAYLTQGSHGVHTLPPALGSAYDDAQTL